MKKLKEMLFKFMSQTLSLKEFETWLYNDDYVNSQLLENYIVFELVNINLNSKHAFKELEKFCFTYFDKEECLIQIVKYNCVVMFFLCTINKTTTQSLMQFGVGEFTKK